MLGAANDERVSVTLLAALTKLPQTPPPMELGINVGLSSLLEPVALLLSFGDDRCRVNSVFDDLSGIREVEGGFNGEAGVIDIVGTV